MTKLVATINCKTILIIRVYKYNILNYCTHGPEQYIVAIPTNVIRFILFKPAILFFFGGVGCVTTVNERENIF